MSGDATLDFDFDRALVDMYPRLRSFCRKLTRGTSTDADDLVQETMMRALGARDQFAVGTNFRGWLFMIARNYHYTQGRKYQRVVQMPYTSNKDGVEGVSLAELQPAPHNQQRTLECKEIAEALSLVSEPFQELLILAMEGLSYEEMAEILGIPKGTAKSRLCRAREAMEAIMGLDHRNATT